MALWKMLTINAMVLAIALLLALVFRGHSAERQADSKDQDEAWLDNKGLQEKILQVVASLESNATFEDLALILGRQGIPLPHPSCLNIQSPMGSEEATGDKACGEKSSNYKITWEVAGGELRIWGKEIIDESEESFGSGGVTIGYRLVSIKGSLLLIRAVWNGGGTGWFSELSLFETERDLNNQIKRVTKMQSIEGGDRCNGGLASYEITPKQFRYGVYLTPFDLINAGHTLKPAETRNTALASLLDIDGEELMNSSKSTNIGGWTAYKELHACAICCVAEMVHESSGPEEKTIRRFVGLSDDTVNGTYAKAQILDKCINGEIKRIKDELGDLIPIELWRAEMLKLPAVCKK